MEADIRCDLSSSVSIVIRLGLADSKSTPDAGWYFSRGHFSSLLWGPISLQKKCTGALSSGELPGRATDSPISTNEVRKQWSYSSCTHTSEHKAECYIRNSLQLGPEKLNESSDKNPYRRQFHELVSNVGLSVSDSKCLRGMGVIIRLRGGSSSH